MRQLWGHVPSSQLCADMTRGVMRRLEQSQVDDCRVLERNAMNYQQWFYDLLIVHHPAPGFFLKNLFGAVKTPAARSSQLRMQIEHTSHWSKYSSRLPAPVALPAKASTIQASYFVKQVGIDATCLAGDLLKAKNHSAGISTEDLSLLVNLVWSRC